jgi:hypothetical protein
VRVQLLDPRGKKCTVDIVLDAVFLVHADLVSRRVLQALTHVELALVYDWAAREHLAASDPTVERRPRPSCLDLAVIVSSLADIAASGESGESIVARFRDRLADLSRRFEASPTVSGVVVAPAVGPRPPEATVDATSSSRGRVGPMDHRVSLDFVVRLPAGLEPPTPTREAVDAAALAMAGPGYELGPDVRVSCVEAPDLWEALAPVARLSGEGSRARIHRALVTAGVTSPGLLCGLHEDALRQIPGLGRASVQILAEAGLASRGRGQRRRRAGSRRGSRAATRGRS